MKLAAAFALAALLVGGCAAGSERQEPKADGANAAGEHKGIMGAATTPAPASANAAAAAPPSTQGAPNATAQPGPGSAQRAAIMDALRPAIERKLAGPVEFVVRRAAVQDGWALVIADPQRPGGGRINPKRHFPNEVIEFMDGLTVNAILRFSGGGWTLVDHAIGPTDVWYCGVEGPPRALTGC
jgi:hypothetical protein